MNKQTWTPRLGKGGPKLLHTKEKGKVSFIIESQKKVFLKTEKRLERGRGLAKCQCLTLHLRRLSVKLFLTSVPG